MSHAEDRIWKHFGFYMSPYQLLEIIRAGNAKERLMMGAGDRARQFDVPITFEDGTKTIVRCLVSLDLDVVITITRPETPLESLRRKYGQHTRKVFKSLKHVAVEIDEAVAPVELDEAARGKLEQERKSAKATFGDALRDAPNAPVSRVTGHLKNSPKTTCTITALLGH
ncbi:MAG: hypothetical protein WA211_04945 [Candidatus Acidiferrales bacterium]